MMEKAWKQNTIVDSVSCRSSIYALWTHLRTKTEIKVLEQSIRATPASKYLSENSEPESKYLQKQETTGLTLLFILNV